jgi:hypothetical protein
MKYSEFRRLAKDMNYNLGETKWEIRVRKKDTNRLIAHVAKDKRFIFLTYAPFKDLNQSEQEELFHLLTELSSTPPEEREEEKRYRLIVDIPQLKPYKYLINYQGEWILSNGIECSYGQTIFTESELCNINEKGFVREEVTE